MTKNYNCLACKGILLLKNDKCIHCYFPKYGTIKHVDPLVRIKNISQLNLGNINEIIAQCTIYLEKNIIVGQWQPLYDYKLIMERTSIRINGYGEEIEYKTYVQQNIYKIMHNLPCTLENIVAIKVYTLFTDDTLSLKTNKVIKNVSEYYNNLNKIPVKLLVNNGDMVLQ
uniref:Uncharacterized protein n=1 Tax=viral metagenome TaxID=1070528 RepID=A0A6C0J7J5_9ZZZZ